jgi:hypothetical protein
VSMRRASLMTARDDALFVETVPLAPTAAIGELLSQFPMPPETAPTAAPTAGAALRPPVPPVLSPSRRLEVLNRCGVAV